MIACKVYGSHPFIISGPLPKAIYSYGLLLNNTRLQTWLSELHYVTKSPEFTMEGRGEAIEDKSGETPTVGGKAVGVHPYRTFFQIFNKITEF